MNVRGAASGRLIVRSELPRATADPAQLGHVRDNTGEHLRVAAQAGRLIVRCRWGYSLILCMDSDVPTQPLPALFSSQPPIFLELS